MATRLYLTTTAPGVSPDPANAGVTWEDTGGIIRGALAATPAGAAASVSRAETSASSAWDVALGQWTTAAFARDGTVDGLATLIWGRSSDVASATNGFQAHFRFWIMKPDGTSRGVIKDALSNIAWTTTATGASVTGSVLSALAVVAGDRLVFELGYRATNTSTSSMTGTVYYGGTTTPDLAASATDMTRPGSVEFDSANLALLFTHDAAATLSGTGALTAGGTPVRPGAAVLAGQGTLTAAVRRQHAAAAAPAGSGTLTAAGARMQPAAVTLAGDGTLAGAADRAHPAPATLTGAGTLTAAGTRDQAAAATLTGTGALTGNAGQTATATLTGTGGLTVALTQTHAAAAALAGTSGFTASAAAAHQATATLTGTGGLTAAGVAAQPAAVTLAGDGTLTAAADRAHPAPATLTGGGALLATGVRARPSAAALTGLGTLTAAARTAAGGTLNPSLWAVDRVTGALTPLPHLVKLSVSPVRNGPGQITLEYPAYGRGAELLAVIIQEDRDLEVEIWLSGRRAGALRGILFDADGDDVAEDAVNTYTGSFLEVLLDEVLVWPQDADEKKELVFTAVAAGQVAATLLAQVQARGGLVGVTRDFTTSTDSTGVGWPTVVTARYSPTATVLDVLGELVDLGLIDGFEVTPARVLRLYGPDRQGVDRTVGAAPTVFRRGRDVAQTPRRHSVRTAGTVVLVAGAEGVYRSASDTSASARRGRRIEVPGSANNLTDPTSVLAYAQRLLTTVTPGAMEVTHGLVFAPGRPRPLHGFAVGDWVWSDTRGQLERLRVWQWSLIVDAGGVRGELVLNTARVDALLKIARSLKRISSGAAVVGTSRPPPTTDTVAPAAPTGLSVASLAYQDGVNEPTRAVVFVNYAAVATNSDGSDCTDLAGYRARLRYKGLVQTGGIGEPGEVIPGGDGTWTHSDTVPSGDLQIEISGVDANAAVEVQVQAFDSDGNDSAWSGGASHTTAADDTPPPTPSTPTTDVWFATLNVTWDGLDSDGSDMLAAAPDFDHVEVHVSTSAGAFAMTQATFAARLYAAGTWNVPGIPHGVAHYARLLAVDRAGNRSGGSGTSAPATAEQLVSQDLIDDIITKPKIADFAVGTAEAENLFCVNGKIANLAVNSAKVSELNVGLLTAGTMTAVVTNSGLFRTAASGNRVEFDAAGLRLYNGATVVGRWQTSDSSMLTTGIFQTGLSGERLVMSPDGTFKFYPTTGSNYSLMANNGNELFLRGPLDGSSRSGQSFYWSSGVGLAFGAYPNSLTSRLSVGDRLISQQGVLLVNVLDGRFTQLDPQGHRVLWKATDAAGADIGNSYLHLSLSLNSNRPWLFGATTNTGIQLNEALYVVANDGSAKGVYASNFANPSAIAVKTDIATARFGDHGLSAMDVVRSARAQRFRYRADLAPRPERPGFTLHRLADDGRTEVPDREAQWAHPQMPAPWHVGPMADDLDDLAPELIIRTVDGQMMLDVGMKAGMAWAAAAEAGDAVLALRREVAELRALLRPGPGVVDGEVA